MKIRFVPFYKYYIPEVSQMPMKWNSLSDIFNHSNDAMFHQQLVLTLEQADKFYFKQFKEVQNEFMVGTLAIARDNVSLNSKDWEYIE